MLPYTLTAKTFVSVFILLCTKNAIMTEFDRNVNCVESIDVVLVFLRLCRYAIQ